MRHREEGTLLEEIGGFVAGCLAIQLTSIPDDKVEVRSMGHVPV